MAARFFMEDFKLQVRFQMTHEKYRGVVEIWNDERGFGRIRPDHDGPSIFIHASGITTGRGRRTLIAGQAVEFEVEPSDRGPKCVNVVVLDQAAT
jgi:CspA family cold shock protein